MRALVVEARSGGVPYGVEDLCAAGGERVDEAGLVAAGQALTWCSDFTVGRFTAIPLDGARVALLVGARRGGEEGWHDRFARGLAHRIAGELTIARVVAGEPGGGAAPGSAEDWDLLVTSIGELTRLLAFLAPGPPGPDAAAMVTDAARTHRALLGELTGQRISARGGAGHTVHTVRSERAGAGRAELERARARIGLPWPALVSTSLGGDLGLARWRDVAERDGHQVWSRVEGDDTLVTEVRLRDQPPPGGAAGMR